MSAFGRRRWFAGLGALAGSALLATPALAGSWLDRAGLLVSHATRDSEYLRKRLTDKDLAEVVHRLAEARLRVAQTMSVPAEVELAHPHLLLVLEAHERAADGAEDGDYQRFLKQLEKARLEESILRGVLKQLGWTLPAA